MLLDNNLMFRLLTLDVDTVKYTYAAYIRKILKRTDAGIKSLKELGYVEIDTDKKLLSDGRIVFSEYGKQWVLSEEKHAEVTEKKIELAKSRAVSAAASDPEKKETKSIAGTDDITKLTCPKCGDALEYSMVCGACAAGIAGYRHRYSCISGCVDFVSKDKV